MSLLLQRKFSGFTAYYGQTLCFQSFPPAPILKFFSSDHDFPLKGTLKSHTNS